jgi:hypothetical protein
MEQHLDIDPLGSGESEVSLQFEQPDIASPFDRNSTIRSGSGATALAEFDNITKKIRS